MISARDASATSIVKPFFQPNALCFQYPYDQSSDNLIPAGSPQVTRVFSLVSIRKSKPWNQSKAPFYNSIYLFPGPIILTAYSCDLFKIGKLHIYHWTLQDQWKNGVQSNHSRTLFTEFELENHSVQKISFLPLTLMQASWCGSSAIPCLWPPILLSAIHICQF